MRQQEIAKAGDTVRDFLTGPRGFSHQRSPTEFAHALGTLGREDKTDDLGALKIFDKTHNDDAQAIQRLEREKDILRAGYSGLPKLLDADSEERWLVTEFFPKGSLEKNTEEFKGNASKALNAFRGLLKTVAHLHSSGIVHRDIKPANIFLSDTGELVLGDFGIAHRVDANDRLTFTNERVGPRDFMPPWADTGERLDEVSPSFDVYMLGKLLWCMVSGKSKLPREYHRRPEYDLMSMFPDTRDMGAVNVILDVTVVEQQEKCPIDARVLLSRISHLFTLADRGLEFGSKGELRYRCLICRAGHYVDRSNGKQLSIGEFDVSGAQTGGMTVRNFVCNICSHRAFFSPQYPDEAARWGFADL